MSAGALVKGFLFGGAIGATYIAVKGAKSKDQIADALNPKPEYFQPMAPNLIPIFVEYLSFYKICPDRWKMMYHKSIQEAIQSIDHLLCIEVQLANQEIKPSMREPMEADKWAMAAMKLLRQVVYYFLQSDYMVQKLTDRANEVLTICALHLDNISKYTYGVNE